MRPKGNHCTPTSSFSQSSERPRKVSVTDRGLIVGLGNPGEQYLLTRHNAGFMFVDSLALSHGASWKVEKKLQAEITQIQLEGKAFLLAKPFTFMNLSGQSIQKILSYFKIDISRLIVVHDDLDMDFGSSKMRTSGGGHGGHNGVRSTINVLKSADFARLKIGIGRPQAAKDAGTVHNWVLGRFSSKELETLQAEVFTGVEARLRQWISGLSK